MIAMALTCEPKLLIADEPTTALDVTIQAQVLDLMNDLKKRLGTAIIFITHDLGVIAEMSQRVLVMYAGKVVENASALEIFSNPKHPYTVGLINSRPDMETSSDRLYVIPGAVPDLSRRPTGCPFHPRCPEAQDICAREYPKLFQEGAPSKEGAHEVFCWKYASTEGQ
jgi:peptide/nickel transport system ATP-binding protein/oligopeptide transport system ATP-binding protein